jgi:hypothetical protein
LASTPLSGLVVAAFVLARLSRTEVSPACSPGIVSTVLAGAMGWERQDFKLHAGRLKALGLTLSLHVGSRLSPRGASYLTYLRSR